MIYAVVIAKLHLGLRRVHDAEFGKWFIMMEFVLLTRLIGIEAVLYI